MAFAGYDEGYANSNCFWGTEPSSLVRQFINANGRLDGCKVLDLGAGEGKNSMYFARHGARVIAIEVSRHALRNAKGMWPDFGSVAWALAEARILNLKRESFDVVVIYGLLHCLRDEGEIAELVQAAKSATRHNGCHILCAINNRLGHQHDWKSHCPITTLTAHGFYKDLYSDWTILHSTDEDLHEAHPHNRIPHVHSMTRIVAIKVKHDDLPSQS